MSSESYINKSQKYKHTDTLKILTNNCFLNLHMQVCFFFFFFFLGGGGGGGCCLSIFFTVTAFLDCILAHSIKMLHTFMYWALNLFYRLQ